MDLSLPMINVSSKKPSSSRGGILASSSYHGAAMLLLNVRKIASDEILKETRAIRPADREPTATAANTATTAGRTAHRGRPKLLPSVSSYSLAEAAAGAEEKGGGNDISSVCSSEDSYAGADAFSSVAEDPSSPFAVRPRTVSLCSVDSAVKKKVASRYVSPIIGPRQLLHPEADSRLPLPLPPTPSFCDDEELHAGRKQMIKSGHEDLPPKKVDADDDASQEEPHGGPPNIQQRQLNFVGTTVEGGDVRGVLRKKFSWKSYPELEAYLVRHRTQYLRYSSQCNYTAEQKRYNNSLTRGLLDLASQEGYLFEGFTFAAVRDRIRCYYKSYVQAIKKKKRIKNSVNKRRP